jgi:protein CpxP
MRILKYILVVLAIAALVGSITMVFAQTEKGNEKVKTEGRRPDGPPMRGFNPRMFEELNLTDEQKTQIKTLHENARTASEQYFEKLKGGHEQIKAIVQAQTFNEEQARQILNAKAQAETELEIIHLRTESGIYNLLTAEQKTKLAELEKNRAEFRRGGDFRKGLPPPRN